MKKRSWIMVILAISLFAAGCADAEADEAIVIEEIPIEQEAETSEKSAETGDESTEDGTASTETETESAEALGGLTEQVNEPDEETQVEVVGDRGTITIGTTGAPFTELLMQAKIQLAKEGWDLQIKKYEDYQKINEDVLNGTLDAHLFAHQTYIDNYNDVNGTNLTAVDKVSYEVYGVYSEINQDLTKITTGSKIGIPADDTSKARALLFMQDLNWITLKEDVGLTAILDDIVENPNNLQFKEYTQENIQQIMSETDYCILGADMAIVAGLDVENGALQTEKKSHNSAESFASLLITPEENVESEKLQVLMNALKSDAIEEYVEETYKGALALF